MTFIQPKKIQLHEEDDEDDDEQDDEGNQTDQKCSQVLLVTRLPVQLWAIS